MTYQKRNSCIAFLGILLLTVFFAPPAHADEAAAASFASHSLALSATENIDYWLFEPKTRPQTCRLSCICTAAAAEKTISIS